MQIDYNKTILEESIHTTALVSGLAKSSTPEKSIERIIKLGKTVGGSGHDCCLKGIIVYHTVEASKAFWPQFGRYHFCDIVTSESTMHSITTMDLRYHHKTPATTIAEFKYKIADYNNGLIDFEALITCIPNGLLLKAGVISNYLQLKTIHKQRKNHTLSEWKEYCTWIESLPLMKEIL